MSQFGNKLRRRTNGYAFWCPGCEEFHGVTDGWDFNGDAEKPTFSPSILVTYNGSDAGQIREPYGRAPYAVCHSFIRGGMIEFCSDSTHPLSGQTVPLPDLPGGNNTKS